MGGGTDGGASMRYQHTNTSHNRSSGFSSVVEIAGGMGLRSPQPQQLGLDFAPAQVRSHGLRDAHTYPLVARRQGRILPCPRFSGVGLPIVGASSGEQLAFDGLRLRRARKGAGGAGYANHLGRPRPDVCPAIAPTQHDCAADFQFAFARFLLPSQTRASRGRPRGKRRCACLRESASSTAKRSALILGTTAS